MFVAARTCSIEELVAGQPDADPVSPDITSVDDGGCGARDITEDPATEWRPGLLNCMELTSLPRTFVLPRQTYERLHPYQRSGVAWMAQLLMSGKGGILADEMGLGKTVQVCSFLDGARKAGSLHALVLLPVTLMDQWRTEARSWCPDWDIFVYQGTPAQRAQALYSITQARGGILLVSYSSYSNNSEHLKYVQSPKTKSTTQAKPRRLKRQRLSEYIEELDDDEDEIDVVPPEQPVRPGKAWDIVICDEAHKLKNISTLLGKNLRKIQARCRLLLTGTPVQNSLQDLWGLMDFAQQGLLGNRRTFVKHFSDPINHGSVRGASSFAVGLKKHLCEELWQLVSPHLLRRTKMNVGLLADDDVGDMQAEDNPSCIDSSLQSLPQKRETILWLMPSDEQVHAYKSILRDSDLVQNVASKAKLGLDVFQVIGLLKRLCNHPLLILRTPSASAWADLVAEARGETHATENVDINQAEQPEQMHRDDNVPKEQVARLYACPAADLFVKSLARKRESLLHQSAKLRCLASLLPALALKGHRTLVFAQSVKMLDLVELCVLDGQKFGHLRIDGQTNIASRAAVIKEFQTDHDRFKFLLLTTNVGGVGLNITSANRVVIVDPAWNPQTDAQAVDRVFRIGQTREVHVYRLVMSGLIEDKMFRLQVFKMGLTRTALEAKPQQHYFTTREIRGLFDWTDPCEGETRMLLAETHGESQEEPTKRHAAEDGCDENFMRKTGVVALSNFLAIFSCLARDEESDACSAQIAEMKKRLVEAEHQIGQIAEERQAAVGSLEFAKAEFENANRQIAAAAKTRTEVEERLSGKQSEFAKIKRMQAAAEQRWKRAIHTQEVAKTQHARAHDEQKFFEQEFDMVARTSSQAKEAMLHAEEALQGTMDQVHQLLSLVDSSGCAVGDSPIDAAAAGFQVTHRAFEHARQALDNVNKTQAELHLAYENLCRIDYDSAEAGVAKLGCSRDHNTLSAELESDELRNAERRMELSQHRSEEAQENASHRVQTLCEAGWAFVKSFRDSKTKKGGTLKAVDVQTNACTTFTRLQKEWRAELDSQETWLKASVSCRGPKRKAIVAATVCTIARDGQAIAETAMKQAAVEEARCQQKWQACESEIAAAETARIEAGDAEANWRKQRDELRARLGAAHLDTLKSRAAAEEASERRAALQAWCSRSENLQFQLDATKFSAVEALKAEAYNAKQVEEAYEARKRPRQEN